MSSKNTMIQEKLVNEQKSMKGRLVPCTWEDLLVIAAEDGNNEELQERLDYKNTVNCHDYRGWTPLTMAAASRHLKTVELLIDKFNADPNFLPTSTHKSALAYAVEKKNPELVISLLKRGAYHNVKIPFNNENVSLKQYAQNKGYKEIVNILTDAEKGLYTPKIDEESFDLKKAEASFLKDVSKGNVFKVVAFLTNPLTKNVVFRPAGQEALNIATEAYLFNREAQINAFDKANGKFILGIIPIVNFDSNYYSFRYNKGVYKSLVKEILERNSSLANTLESEKLFDKLKNQAHHMHSKPELIKTFRRAQYSSSHLKEEASPSRILMPGM